MKKTLSLAACAALTLGFGFTPAMAAPAAPPPGDPIYAGESMPAENSDEIVKVMVLLKSQPDGVGNEVEGLAEVTSVANRYNGKNGVNVRRSFGKLVRGFSASMPASQIAVLAADPEVASVERQRMFYQSMQSAGQLTTSVQARSHYNVDGRGLIVSIIDSGIDIAHQDMRIDDAAKPSMKMAPQAGWTDKVPFGWNFSDDSAIVKDTGSQHGMHVAGIVAANAGDKASVESGRINGIAPNAQLLAMKVFSNDPINGGGASEDDVIAAIEKSVEMKADIINMSLGSPNGLSEGGLGEGRAILNAQKAGVQVIVASGNDGLNFSKNGDLFDQSEFLDNGVMANPASTPGSWAVASISNSAAIVKKATATWTGGSLDFAYAPKTGKVDGKPHTLVDCGLGQPADVPDTAKGNYCLIQRGTIPFAEKFKNATEKGATGILIYNNAGDAFIGMGGIDSYTIPSAAIFQSVGEKLKAQIANGLQVALADGYAQAPLASSLKPSDFTSWGATPELEFRPNISGIGGSVWSTANNNGYQEMSGTSMATPHIAGVFALGLQEYAKRYPAMTATERGDLLKTSLSNTAMILKHDDIPYAPRQVGAGLAQTDNALTTSVFATVDNLPSAALRQLNGPKTFTVTLANKGDKPRTFTAGGTCVVNETKASATVPQSTVCGNETATPSQSSVTVPANGTATVSYTVTPAMDRNHWIEGWVTFTSADAEQPSLNLPYMGFAGDWNAERIIDAPKATVMDTTTTLLKMGASSTNATGLYSSNGNMMSMRMFSLAWISPNGDGIYDNVYPSLAFLRSAKDLKFSIVDKDGKVVRELGEEHNRQRSTLAKLIKGNRNFTVTSRQWDGTLYDPSSDSFKAVADGTSWTYRVEARLSADMPWQKLDQSFKIDMIKPKFEITSKEEGNLGWTYNLKASDQGGSGIYSSGITAIDAQTGKKLPIRMKTIDTFSFLAGSELKGHPIVINYTDIAGNGGSVVDICGASGAKFVDIERFAHPINGKSKDAAGALIINADGKIELSAAVSADVVKTQINGQDAPIKDGIATYTVKAETGVKTFTLVGFDAAGKELSRDEIKIIIDLEKPVVTITKAPFNEKKQLVLDENGAAVIEGKVTDNRSVALPKPLADGTPDFDNQLWLLDSSLQPYPGINEDGTFSITVVPEPTESSISLLALDYFDPISFKFLNLNGVRIPLARAATEETGTGPLQITFDEKRFEGKPNPATGKPAPFGDSLFILDKTYQGLSVKDGKATLNFSGRFNRAPGKFMVHGKEIKVDNNLHFSVEIPLTDPITTYGYELYEKNGSLINQGVWKFFYDKDLPAYVLNTTPAVAQDGVIYLQDAKGAVKVDGEVSDNGSGYTFAINGQVLANVSNVFDPGAKINLRKYQTTVDAADGQFMRISTSDFMGNSMERSIPIVSDLDNPVIAQTGIPDGNSPKVNQGTKITVTARDNHIKDMKVLIDGKVVKTVDAKITADKRGKIITKNPNDPSKPDTTVAADGHTVAQGSSDGHTVAQGSSDGHTVCNGRIMDGHTVAQGLAMPQVDPAAEPLTYVVNTSNPGSHTLEVVATDLSGRSTTLAQPFVVTNDLAPVIGGPDKATIDPDKGDLLKQIQDLYPVTDDLDKGLKVSADVSVLRLDKAVELTLTAKDSGGNVIIRKVTVTLQRPETRLDGVCGWMNARFAKGDTITITCVKKADGTTTVTIKSSGVVVIGRIYLPGFSKLLSEPYKPVAAAKEGMSNGVMSLAPVSDDVALAADNETRVENGVLSFTGSSDASYEVASAAVDQPERPAPPSVVPGTPNENGTAPSTGRVPAAANAANTAAKIAATGTSTSATGAALAGLLLLVAGAVAIRKGRRQES